MKKIAFALVVLCWLTVGGCTTVKELRVHNASTLDYSGVRVANQHFGHVAAGETSDYRQVKLRFRYADMEMKVNGRRVTGQTLNFGANQLTHRIDVIDLDKGHLNIQVVHD